MPIPAPTARTRTTIASPHLAVMFALALALGASPADQTPGPPPAEGQSSPPRKFADDGEPDPADLQDRPEPLLPLATRSEADQDRIDATIAFAAARAHEQRQDYEKALRLYERAVQAAPNTPAILRHIVILAFNLDRRAEAARYAQLLESHDPDDAVLLRRLGLELAEEDDLEGALSLYLRGATVATGEKVDANSVLWWMEMGRLYYLTQQYELAAEQFAKIQQALANPAELGVNDALRKVILGSGDLTYRLFGECFLEAAAIAQAQSETEQANQRLGQAQAAFEKSNEYKDNPALLAYGLARVAAHRDQPAEALAKLQVALDAGLSSQGTEPYELLAKLLADLGQSDQLIGRLEKLRAGKEDNAPLTFVLAETYRKAEKVDLATQLYRQLCNPDRQQAALEAWRGYIALLHAAGRWNDLLPVLGGALELTGGWKPLGEAGKSLLADQAAVDALLAVARRDRAAGTGLDDSARWLAAGFLASNRQQYDDAAAYFELALAAAPAKSAELLFAWGVELLGQEQFVRSADVFRRGTALQLPPAATAEFYYYLSSALALLEQTDEALVAARRAAALESNEIAYLVRIGWILNHAKGYGAAAKAYEQTIAKLLDGDPPSAATRKALHDVRLALSNIEIYQNHLDRAEAWLEELWDEYPTDPGVLNDLGYSWADRGKHLNRSLRMIRQAVEAEPKNLAFRDSLGWALYRLGQFPEAVSELRTATEVEKPDPMALDHLGDALMANQQPAEARDIWKRAIAGFDEEGEVEKRRNTQGKIDATEPTVSQTDESPKKPAS